MLTAHIQPGIRKLEDLVAKMQDEQIKAGYTLGTIRARAEMQLEDAEELIDKLIAREKARRSEHSNQSSQSSQSCQTQSARQAGVNNPVALAIREKQRGTS